MSFAMQARIAVELLRASFAIVGPALPLADQSAALPAAPAVTRALVQRSPVPGTDLETRLYLITFPPGSTAEPHIHPVTGIGYILRGCADSTFEGRPSQVLRSGQSFRDPARVRHVVFRNRSSSEPLVFLVAYTDSRNGEVTVFEAAPSAGGRL